MILVKEDGSGKADANCYAAVADGDAYHEGHLYASGWTGAVTADKEKALVMATRVIDAMFRFNGFKGTAAQALQWPRRECRDPDVEGGLWAVGWRLAGPWLPENQVPTAVVQAACELARELLEANRTDNPMGEGLRKVRIEGALELDFDPKDKAPPVPRLVQMMLGRFGEYLGLGGGMVRLVRV